MDNATITTIAATASLTGWAANAAPVFVIVSSTIAAIVGLIAIYDRIKGGK